jgi:hypothetical protein
MDTILDEYSIEDRNILDVDITEGKELGYQFIFNTKTDDNISSVKLKLEVVRVNYFDCNGSSCPLKEYRCDGINCNVKLVEILK